MLSTKAKHNPTLETVLADREAKAEKIKSLATKYNAPVVGIRVNIPGPEKKTPWAFKLYRAAVTAVEKMLDEKGIVYFSIEMKAHYEFLTLVVVRKEAPILKQYLVEIEETSEIGRVFDLDVYMADGIPLSREAGHERKCYLCDESAHACARSRAHSFEALEQYLISKASAL
ncbi:MAG: holo-ACP synthase [Clostridiales bacterium]|jgi:holo-ACP synthase|nr:holo-ACP synthase [Clostridiales bacterium]MDN5299116.1 holo-ACP synthase [Clostridiales bacterium]